MAAPARERLTRLVDLASKSDVPARELTGELTDLLLDWPENYPLAMREPFEALLEKSLRDLEPAARTLLAERFIASKNMPVSVLNALIFDAAPETRQAILARNASEPRQEDKPPPVVDEQALLAAVRSNLADTATALAAHFAIPRDVAARSADDASGFSLAVHCKGAGCHRATFSAIAVLAQTNATQEESYRRLAIYDHVPSDGAHALLQFWRGQSPPPVKAANAD